MVTQTQTSTSSHVQQTQKDAKGRNKSRRGRGGAGRGNASKSAPVGNAATEAAAQLAATAKAMADAAPEEEGDLCWICAEPVKYYSISQCNHRTCHVCALRLRALYKKTECTFCKVCVL